MKVLMFGWEFPPFKSGGLGTACYGLTKGLAKKGVSICFVLPKAGEINSKSHVDIVVASNLSNGIDIKIKQVDSMLVPYINTTQYSEKLYSYKAKKGNSINAGNELYGSNLFEEVHRYAEKAKLIVAKEDFDIIHAHDWMTYPAAIKAKELSNKPLIVHIHATEFDRTADNPNNYVYNIEREGLHAADKIIAVSNYTKGKLIEHYGISPDKVQVVHNGVDLDREKPKVNKSKNEKIVLYLGRITIQKGPEYFLYSAKKVLEHMPNVKFVVAGTGDMMPWMIEKAAELGIGNKVLFSGFLRGKNIDRAYRLADLYVLPSVSEPFGITPLEAMRNGTPCIVSKTSGVSEVINHCIKVDFWDIEKMSGMIISVLNYGVLHKELKKNAEQEVKQLNWDRAAEKCYDIYKQFVAA